MAKHVKSNAIVYADADRRVGIGAGQMSRVDSARLAIAEGRERRSQARVMASDAFFPFRDGFDVAAEAGVRRWSSPADRCATTRSIAAADEHGMAMVFTGRRHFRH